MEYAAAGQPPLVTSLAIAGATGPVTLAGNLALQNAEVLAGIVLAQLVREGTPVIFGGASSNTEMRNGTLSICGDGSDGALLQATGTMRWSSLRCQGFRWPGRLRVHDESANG
jgi:trimethylamine:corrinoid methyltransferase-like protein